MPGLTIGDTIPNLEVESTNGKINLHHFCTDTWTILFSHPDCKVLFRVLSMRYEAIGFVL
ncbi:putative peroxiredoxin [Lupinus albus]|uniref:Putative peroxiredoxin n=1 Tax=Lupinus albus TaxID=3870 RepID=A0A6A4PHM9_LUPAL|nr:putative peroxiredoxin [Lupinus albus]